MRQPDHWWHRVPCPALVSETVDDRRVCASGRVRCFAGLGSLAGHSNCRRSASRSSTTATSGRSWPRTASRATGPIVPPAKADLRLDKRDAAIEAGAIAPGDIESSELIARINAADPKEVMPPAVDHQDAEPEAKRCAQAVDFRRCSLSIALVVHRAGASRAAQGQESIVGRGTRSMVSCWPSSRKTG